MSTRLKKPDNTFVAALGLSRQAINVPLPTIPTAAGSVNAYINAPFVGKLVAAYFSGVDALATSDTNYASFTVTNLGQDGLGTNAMLASTPAGVNTTKATGGAAIVANTKKTLTVHGTAGNKVVAETDRIKITATVTGTLGNTVTFPVVTLVFERTA